MTSPIPALGLKLSRFFERTAPDPFVLAIALTALTAAICIAFGDYTSATTLQGRALATLDAWRGQDGLWQFLAFAMRMCLVLVTGHALAVSPPVRALVRRVAALPRSGAQAAALVGLTAALFGLINWGLGLIVGALLAREVALVLAKRKIPHHYPLLAAAGYMGMLVWHGGLSGSAPLTMAKPAEASAVLPAGFETYAETGIELSRTIGAPINLLVTGGLLVLIPLALALLNPRTADCRTASDCAVTTDDPPRPPIAAKTIPEWLDRSPLVAWLLALALGAGVARYITLNGPGAIGLDEINATMLALGLFFHAGIAPYLKAAEDGARGCVGIILQFPLYAGIMGMLATSGLIALFSARVASLGGAHADILMYAAAAIVNLFVPSGGGQWGIQGPVALQAAAEAGIDPARMVLAVAWGDQLTNMLQPFWALPLLAITGVKARDIVGYTVLVMLAAAAWTIAIMLIA